jgi:hypothetical protein
MKRYSVYVRRSECQYVSVEAESADEAMDRALEKSVSVLWDDDPEFEALAVEEEVSHGNKEDGQEEGQ